MLLNHTAPDDFPGAKAPVGLPNDETRYDRTSVRCRCLATPDVTGAKAGKMDDPL